MNLLGITRSQLILIDNESFLNEFVTQFYSKDSYNQVYSKLNKHVIKKFGKHFSEFTYDDYQVIQNEKKSSADIKNYANTLFKFLFSKEVLIDDEFKGIFPLEKVKEHFVKRTQNKDRFKLSRPINKYPILEFEDLLKLESFYEVHTDSIEKLKMKLCWYILNEYDFNNKDILSIKSDNFDSGQLLIGDEIIELPNIFEELFEQLSKRKNDGFTNLNGNLKDLAREVGITKNLTPQLIKNTKTVNTLTCPNCQEKYSSDLHNWCAIEEKLVCKDCGDLLRKVLSYQQLSNSPIEKVNNFEVFETLEKEYDKRKKELTKKGVDFQRLYEVMQEIGRMGEKYVFKLEYQKLINTPFANKIDKSIADNPKNGYDILSYDLEGNKIYIEVKATSTDKDEFYISQHELDTAEQLLKSGKQHYVYFVKNILSENPILTIIDNILNDDRFTKVGHNWKMVNED